MYDREDPNALPPPEPLDVEVTPEDVLLPAGRISALVGPNHRRAGAPLHALFPPGVSL